MMKKYIFSALICFGLFASGMSVHGMEGNGKGPGRSDEDCVISVDVPLLDQEGHGEMKMPEVWLMKKVFNCGMEFYCFEGIDKQITLSQMREKQTTGSFSNFDDEAFFQTFGSAKDQGIWLVINADKLEDLREDGTCCSLQRSCKDFDWVLGFLKKIMPSYQGDLRLKKLEEREKDDKVTRFDPEALEDKVCVVYRSYEEETEIRRETLREFIKDIESVRDLQKSARNDSIREFFRSIFILGGTGVGLVLGAAVGLGIIVFTFYLERNF